MTRFNQTKVDSSSGTVEVGPGLTWDQVYVALGPSGVNVLGGRVPGVGVAGLTLGGGECLRLSEKLGLICFQVIHFCQVSMDFRLTTLPDMSSSFRTELS
jgi:hypothetical protein